MSESLFNDVHARIAPQILTNRFSMGQPNESILLYQGDFALGGSDEAASVAVSGKIFFSWFPYVGPMFSGTLNSKFSLADVEGSVNVIVNREVWGIARITNVSVGESTGVEGRFIGKVVVGNKSVPVSQVSFVLANLREFFGEMVKDRGWTGRQRLIFQDNVYQITIDKRREFKVSNRQLSQQGGYLIGYFGELQKKGGFIEFAEAGDLLESLTDFLTFLNGRRCSPILRTGLHEDKVIWADYSGHVVDDYRPVWSWTPRENDAKVNLLWQSFCKLWKDPNDRDFLHTAIHWYVAANSNAGLAEGSIIMTQTALELVYNWLIVEKMKLIHKPDSDTLAASNKIRLIVSKLNMRSDFPTGLQKLKELKDVSDAPEAFVRIRNAIVHSNEKKRKDLVAIDGEARVDALFLGLWYLELALLKILGYKGDYRNRTNRSDPGKMPVPWAHLIDVP